MQFNAVVADNKGAISLYKKLGFKELGTIPGGFKMDDGTFVDIIPFYFELSSI
jgi:ribosomal protein S18 acetylase RimI-like enzyme